jgi:hypothetical protein
MSFQNSDPELDLYFPNKTKIERLENVLDNLVKSDWFVKRDGKENTFADMNVRSLVINNFTNNFGLYFNFVNVQVKNEIIIDVACPFIIINKLGFNVPKNIIIRINKYNDSGYDYNNIVNLILFNYNQLDFLYYTGIIPNKLNIEGTGFQFIIFHNAEINEVIITTPRDIILIFINSRVTIIYNKIEVSAMQTITCDNPKVLSCKNQLCESVKPKDCPDIKPKDCPKPKECPVVACPVVNCPVVKQPNNIIYIVTIVILFILVIVLGIMYFRK